MGSGITAVVVSYNSARHFAALAQAFRAGTVAPARMLVVDNASTDDSVIRARAAGFDVVQLSSNDGFGAACNAGLRATDTEFVLFCNPDIVPSVDALEQLSATLTNTPTAAIVGPTLREPPEARRFSRLTENLWYFIPAQIKLRLSRYEPRVTVLPDRQKMVVDFVEGAFLLCRASALRSVDGFDQRFFLYSEEEDLSRRLGAHGWKTLLVPAASVAHGYSESSDGVDKAMMESFRLQSLYWYYRRYHSRAYAEVARSALSLCVACDRTYRALTRQTQVYGAGAVTAAFRSNTSLRRAHDRRRPQ